MKEQLTDILFIPVKPSAVAPRNGMTVRDQHVFKRTLMLVEDILNIFSEI